ncbi:DUF6799 domain-containing protein [Lacinutrix venerupis]|nr:DUF6799 domain-containing protein [Lacinutrix venerupis]
MKKLILMSFLFLMSISTAIAQDKPVDSDYVILLNEKVFYYHNDGVKPLNEELKLNDGTVVKTDGTYIKDKKNMKLSDGECLGMSGKKYNTQLDLTKKILKERKK